MIVLHSSRARVAIPEVVDMAVRHEPIDLWLDVLHRMAGEAAARRRLRNPSPLVPPRTVPTDP